MCIVEKPKLASDKIVQLDPGKQCSVNIQTILTDIIPEASRSD